MAISHHPEPSAGALPFSTGEPDSRRAFHPMHPPTVSPVDLHTELGPRSLDADRSFWSAPPSLFEARTSPTDFCNDESTCEQPNPSSRILVGTKASTSFLF